MTEPTEGPWTIEEAEDGSAYTVQVSPRYQACIIGGDGTALADVRCADFRISRSPDEARSNARLMAASPALLAALVDIERIAAHGDVNIQPLLAPILDVTRAARAKARGVE